MFRRKITDELKEWKSNWSGRYALLIEGARRVGKTTVVRAFAESEYRTSIVLDFSQNDPRLKALFEESYTMDMFFTLLQELTDTVLYERDSVIVFDEVQLYPKARQMIKHLVEDGRYDYIETGSMISIKQNTSDILIPSEEMAIQMHPLDFEEFVWALGESFPRKYLEGCFSQQIPVSRPIHMDMLHKFAVYMVVGGMPQAVSEYIGSGNLANVDRIKSGILDLYRNDLAKLHEPVGTKARAIFKHIPSLLSEHEKTFSPSDIRRGSKIRDYVNAVDWLSESKIVNICYRCTDPDPAMDLFLDLNSFKLYMADTGLLMTSAFSSNDAKSEVYEMILKHNLGGNKGMLFENVVAQELVATGRSLAFSKRRSENNTYGLEVDFIITDGKGVVPVEVKSSSRSSSHKSLDEFMKTYSRKVSKAYVIHQKNIRADGDIVYIPVYMTMFI